MLCLQTLSVTFAQRLGVVPVGVSGADALDDGGALLQSVTLITCELDHSAHPVQRVRGREVPVLKVRLVAVTALKRCGRKHKENQ